MVVNNNQRIKNKFFKFLKKNKCYKSYCAYTEKEFGSVDKFFQDTLIASYISQAFSWAFTKEGQTFWSIVNYDWQEYIRKKHFVDKYNSDGI